ncbi:hypothetical protein RCL1_005056 [Eukaryota sp. TZLM3-RCL]
MHLQDIHILLKRTVEIDTTDASFKGFPLHSAAASGDFLTIQRLVKAGHDVDAKDLREWTPLHVAVSRGNRSCVNELLSLGANPLSPDVNGWTSLHVAVRMDYHELLPILLQIDPKKPRAKPKNSPDPRDSSGITPFHLASLFGHLSCANVLIAADCDISLRDTQFGLSALHFAAFSSTQDEALFNWLSENLYVNIRDLNGYTPLHYASMLGNTATMTALIAKGAKSDERTTDGFNVLHLAVKEGVVESVETLLEGKFIDESIKTDDGDTCLHLAVKAGNLEVVKAVLSSQSPAITEHSRLLINIVDSLSSTPLHLGCIHGYRDVVQLLLKSNSPLNPRDSSLKTPLHHAVINERQLIVSDLIGRGADVRVQDDCGKTPLHYASELNFHTIGKSFVDVDPNHVILTFQDVDGNTPIHYLVANNNESLVKSFLSRHPFNLSLKNNDGLSVLDLVASSCNLSLLSLFLDTSSSLSSTIDLSSSSALIHAVSAGADDCVSKLLKIGISPNIFPPCSISPLLIALSKGFASIALMLLQHGATITAKDSEGQSPLHYAIKASKSVLVSRLLQLNAPVSGPECMDVNRKSPLHLAIQAQHNGIVQSLLQHKADVLARDLEGNTPLHVACTLGYTPCVPWLIQFGDKKQIIDAKNLKQETPLHLAVIYGHLGIVEYLVQIGANTSVFTIEGMTIGFLAVKFQKLQVLAFLIKHDIINVNEIFLENYEPTLSKLPIKTVETTVGIMQGDSLLHYAISLQCSEISQCLLDHKANPNIINQSRSTPLHVACAVKYLEGIKLLLRYNANQSIFNSNQESPLLISTKVGDLDAMDLLLSSKNAPSRRVLLKALTIATLNNDEKAAALLFLSGVKNDDDLNLTSDPLRQSAREKELINDSDDVEINPLHVAVKFSLVKIVQNLVSVFGADPNILDENFNTPCHVAAENGNIEIGFLLLKRGANINLKNKEGKTPIMIAVENGKMTFAIRMIDESTTVFDCDTRDSLGNTALHYAAQFGDENLALKLLSCGSYSNSQNNKKRTPLHVAANYGQISIVFILIKNNADVLQPDKEGLTAIHFAARNGHTAILKQIFHNKNLNSCIVDAAGKTPLMHALLGGHLNSSAFLLNLIDKLDEFLLQCGNGATLLHYAALGTNAETIKLVLDKMNEFVVVVKTKIKAHQVPAIFDFPNLQDYDDLTPLHISSSLGHYESVEALLDCPSTKVNVVAIKPGHVTPLHLTFNDEIIDSLNCAISFENCRKLLVSKGASCTVKDYQGNTVMHYTVDRGDYRSLFLFMSFGADPTIVNNLNRTALHVARTEVLERIIPKWAVNITKDISLKHKNNTKILPSLSVLELVHRAMTGEELLEQDEILMEKLLVEEPVQSFNLLNKKLSAFYLLVLETLRTKQTPRIDSFYTTRKHDKPVTNTPVLLLSTYTLTFSTSADVAGAVKKNNLVTDTFSIQNIGDGDANIRFILPPCNQNFVLDVEPLTATIKRNASLDIRVSFRGRQSGSLRDVLYVEILNGMRIFVPIRVDVKS